MAQSGAIGQDNQTTDQLYFWREPGQITNVPIPYEGGRIPGHSGYQQMSNRLISDGSYIRLKQVSLNYNFPKTLLNKAKIEEVNVFLQGINLWTLTKYNGLDPEVNSLGETYGTYPSSKQITAGINLTF
jgi:hypothetical protein